MKKLLPVALALLAAGCTKAPEPVAEAKPPYLVYVTNEGSGDLTVIDPAKPEEWASGRAGCRRLAGRFSSR
jgi:hypothetical protein